MTTTTAPAPTVLAYCETGDHFVAADVLYPGHMDPAMGQTYIESICEDCNDDAVAAYYG